MTQKRPGIPKYLRESILDEFNHRCAICGSDHPQIHHIDNDRTNNAAENLLPLCANHHLVDQHNPTQSIDKEKLRLFRQFKDPTILKSEFDPLFHRIRFLLDLPNGNFDGPNVYRSIEDLIAFVTALEMGQYYGNRLQQLLECPSSQLFTNILSEPEWVTRKNIEEANKEFCLYLQQNKQATLKILVELLRYQPWFAAASKKPISSSRE